MEEKMKVIGRKMSMRMGVVMSFFLALVGTLTSGHFTPVGFAVSFVVSAVVSLVIGFVLIYVFMPLFLKRLMKKEMGEVPRP